MAKSRGHSEHTGGKKRPQLTSTTSLGKRRRRDQSPKEGNAMKDNEYGSQATPFARVAANPKDLVKVAILGAAGGIGQPLSLLLMQHSEYIQHLALHDLSDSIHGVGLDLSHVDRQVKITSHLGQESLAEAVKGARVIVIPAGLAQKPGMSRDDLFASNAEIMLNLAKICATVAPDAMMAIITNPVNSLVPLTCEVYGRLCGNKSHHHQLAAPAAAAVATGAAQPTGQSASPSQPAGAQSPTGTSPAAAAAASSSSAPHQAAEQSAGSKPVSPRAADAKSEGKSEGKSHGHPHVFEDSFRRIFGVTTLDVVRASTLAAKSVFFKNEPSGLHVDPSKFQVPVVGGHAGKTIMPLLSQATPKIDKDRLQKERASTLTLIESVQQAGIDVLNAKKGRGSATLAMAYAACRFTISLLRAQSGEQNIVECAYVRHQSPVYADLDYFATPLLLGKDGYVKSLGLGKTLPFEQQMLEEGARELKLSIARGEDFARERLYSEHK